MAAAPGPASYTPRHISEEILAVPSAAGGERKQVTVLFCDIVRSSDVARQLVQRTQPPACSRPTGIGAWHAGQGT